MLQAILTAVPVLIAGAVMFPCLAGWKVLGGADLTGIYYPFMEFARNAFVRDGVFPMWLPSIFGGVPFEESMVPSLYYPTDILCWLLGLPQQVFYSCDIFLHLALAGAGAALLARAAGSGRVAGAFAGSAYLLNGYMAALVRSGTLAFIRSAGLYPWIILALLRALKKPSLGRWLAVSALLALLPLTSAYQPLAYMAVFLPLLVLLLPAEEGRAKSLGRLALAGALAVVLAGATIIPAARYYLSSIRASGATSWQDMDAYPLSFLNIFLPTANPAWTVKYLGVITALAALAGLVRRWRHAWPWLLPGITSLFFALGTQTPVGRALGHLPFLGSFRGASHWIGLLALSVAVMSALGFEALFAANHRRMLAALAVLGILNTADLYRQSQPLANAHRPSEYEESRPAHDPVVWYLSQRPGDFRTSTAEQHIMSNVRVPSGLEWISGYHGAPLAVFGEFYDATMGGCSDIPALLSWLNTKYFVVLRNQQMRGLVPLTQFNSLTAGQVWICENPSALPRAFFGAGAEPAGGIAVMQRLCSEPPGKRLLYVHSQAGYFPAGRLASGKVLSQKRTPNRLEAEVDSAGTGLVFFSEAFYPAWTAFVDGQRARLLRVNVMFRAVAINRGRHSIVMHYQSLPFQLGLFLSFLGWTLAGAYFLAGKRGP